MPPLSHILYKIAYTPGPGPGASACSEESYTVSLSASSLLVLYSNFIGVKWEKEALAREREWLARTTGGPEAEAEAEAEGGAIPGFRAGPQLKPQLKLCLLL